jgi:hypothetical protein
MTEQNGESATTLLAAACYEQLITAENDDFEWPEFDERTAASLCYTSGHHGDSQGSQTFEPRQGGANGGQVEAGPTCFRRRVETS